MSEPVVVRPEHIRQVLIDVTDGTSHATALRELADFLDSTMKDPIVLSVSIHWGTDGGESLTALVEETQELT